MRRYGWLVVLGALALGWSGYLWYSQPRSPARQAMRKWREHGRKRQRIVFRITVPGDGKMSTATQTTDGAASVTGLLSATHLENAPGGPGAMEEVRVGAGGLFCVFRDITVVGWDGPNPQPVGGHQCTYAQFIELPSYVVKPHSFYYWDTGDPPLNLEQAYSFNVSGQRLRRAATEVGHFGRSGVCFASDRAVTESWAVISPLAWSVSFGALSASGSFTPPPPLIFPINDVGVQMIFVSGYQGVEYARCSVDWSAVPVSFDGLYKTKSQVTCHGDGNALYLVPDANVGPFTPRVSWLWDYSRPHLINFSDFSVRDPAGTLLTDLGIVGPFRADPRIPWTLTDCPPQTEGTTVVAGTPILLSVGQIRSIGHWAQSAGMVAVDNAAPDMVSADYAFDLMSSYALNFPIWGGYPA